ncbi:MAG: radical SAM protein [Oscillospiraceae bacterium]|nr:radical SAM protein [Oscillospiraceae bacterium]MBQ3502026.1 radical SAM protein [Oscillospiraceae bacterium]
MIELSEKCNLCPRKCGADRLSGKTGFCGGGRDLKVARAALHFWEEPCISGESGSGTVFFSGCTMRCIFCQNREISRGEAGKIISIERLAEIFLELQAKGANNINLVTPMHFAPQITAALDISRKNGLSLPIVWNTGGWEIPESIAAVKNYSDIWLTDMKYFDDSLAKNFSDAKNYFEIASASLRKMVEQTGEAVFDENGIMQKGVIVRHLVLPGHTDDSKKILRWLWENFGNRIWVSIMNQYTPLCTDERFPELFRSVSDEEYDDVIDFAAELGFENAFVQEGGAVGESFIPPFDLEGV